jgi:hypothetical protein
MLKKSLTALTLAGAATAAQADTLLMSQQFNDVAALSASGWVRTNAGTPPGATPAWYQGDQQIFAAQSGPANSYAAANWANAAPGGTLSSWLITPIFSTAKAGYVSFFVRADMLDPYTDTIDAGFSTGSSAIDAFSLGDAITGTGVWTEYKMFFSGMGAGAVGRFAIHYTGLADNANYIGVDTLSVNVPEPSTMMILAAGMLGLYASRRRAQR